MALYAIVNVARLNLREAPNTNARILRVLTQDERLEVLNDTGAGWLNVRVPNSSLQGYVSASFVTLTSEEPDDYGAEKGVVMSSALNLRTGPGVNFERIAVLPGGTVLTISGREGEWLKVKAGEREGYVSAQFVRVGDSITLEGYLIDEPELLNLRPQATRLIPVQRAGTPEAQVARVWNVYGGLLAKLAQVLAIPVDVIVGVLVAESGGQAYGPDGRLLIRFENHIFYRYWGNQNESVFNAHFSYDRASGWRDHLWRPDASSAWISFHGNQSLEWRVFDFARSLSESAAMLSISMGAPQIMGFNYARLGYPSVQAMFSRFSGSVHAQIIGIFDFVKGPGTSSAPIAALQRRDYLTFATFYNGSGNAQTYAELIARFAGIYQRLIQTAR